MIWLNACPVCHCSFITPPTDPVRYSITRPWPVTADMRVYFCSKCKTNINVCHHSYGEYSSEKWAESHEFLVEGEDYHVVVSRGNIVPFSSDLTAFVVLSPIATKQWYTKIDDAIFAKRSYLDSLSSLLVIPDDVDVLWFEKSLPLFNRVWKLSSDLTSNIIRPYPSMMVDKRIDKTLNGMRVTSLFTVWPSFVFPRDSMVQIDSDDNVIAAWVSYAREHIQIQIKE